MRILLKLSGESFKWQKEFWIDSNFVNKIVNKIVKIVNNKLEIVIVIWWGNIYRWWDLINSWVNSTDSHNLSMLSTVFNWIVLKNFLEQKWIKSVVMDPNGIDFLERYNKDKANKYLLDKKIVICTWWTWNPYFTTDTWAVLRWLELECDLVIKATQVDWIYNKDPNKYNDAEFISEISYDEFLNKNIKVMDSTAIVLAKENNKVIQIVNINKEDSIYNVLKWKEEGSIIK